jgi:hypothetical protein
MWAISEQLGREITEAKVVSVFVAEIWLNYGNLTNLGCGFFSIIL